MFAEIVFETDRYSADLLTDSLVKAGALSASIEDADAGLPDEEPLFGEPGASTLAADDAMKWVGWNRSRIVALFDEHADVDAAIEHACAVAEVALPGSVVRRAVADADWVRQTQSQFEPIAVGRRLWVVPSWHALPSEAQASDAVVLALDPGLAFGTGSHATTRFCLSWLEQNLTRGSSVIDYGCGSGILAIAAKKLGAGEVTGTDLDPQALTASIDNAVRNDCAIEFVAPEALIDHEPVDLVIANILSNPLKLLAPVLSRMVAAGGALVLCGILERQWREVAEVYAELDRSFGPIGLELWRADEGWACLHGRRAPDAVRALQAGAGTSVSTRASTR